MERSVRNATFTPVATTEMTYDWAARQTTESSYDGESISQSFTRTYDQYGKHLVTGDPNGVYDFETGTTETVDTSSDAGELPPAEDTSGIYEAQSPVGSRVRIVTATNSPYNKIVFIEFTDGFKCSGWLSDNNTVITAGHCIYTHTSPRKLRTVRWITPARNDYSSNPTPYGRCGPRRQAAVSVRWHNAVDYSYDVGAVFPNCSFGSPPGFFEYPAVTRNMTGETTLNSGYPQDKHDKDPYRRWAQYWSKGQVDIWFKPRTGENVILTSNWGYHVVSGAPVYRYDPNRCPRTGYCVVGIVSRFDPYNHHTLAVVMDGAVRYMIVNYWNPS